ncbi:putative cleavage and polyadenylylation specificity factor, partial [Aureobasidium melanogenum]
MFTFTPLLGAQSESAASQSLLELDGGVKILVDVGWDESLDADKLVHIEQNVSTISLILLTHPTLNHLGAFAHCCKHIPLFSSIPVYATTPVVSLGRTLIQDLYASAAHQASIVPPSALAESLSKSQVPANFLLQPPTADEIASYFSLINPLKYSQPHQPIPSPFSPPLNGLTITAYNAGHTLGGTIWHLQHALESIVYAVDWNQAKENVLSGAAWLGGAGGGAEVIEQLRRPTALVCSTKGADRSHLAGGRKKRDDALLALVTQTISNGGTVLIPTDSSARMLELAYILEHHWRQGTNGPNQELYKNTKLAFAAKSASATLRYARSMIEWMDDAIVREMEAAVQGRSENTQKSQTGRDEDTPFDLKYLKLVEKKTQLHRILDSGKPAVILASDKNLIVLTERAANPSPDDKGIGRFLWEYWRQQVESRDEDANVVEMSGAETQVRHLDVARLEGDENLLYQQYLARRRQMHSTLQGDNTLTKENAAELADDGSSTSSESSDESENEHQGRALNISATMTHRRKVGLTDAELGINVLLRRKNVYDYDVRGKRGREKVFPYVAKRGRADDFGEVIRPEEYLRAEEKDDTDGQDAAEAKTETAVGQKRKWDEVAPRAIQNGRTDKRNKTDERESTNANSTNQDHDMNGDAASESEESDYEPEEALPEGPLKAVFTKESLQFNLRIAYIDFSGLHEKRDLQMLIPLIRPRKLILVAGEEAETLALAEDCKTLLATGEGNAVDILTPIIGETVDASVDTNAWTLKLSRDLVKKLAWQNVKGLGIVAVTGRLEAVQKIIAAANSNGDEALKRKKQKMIEGGDENDALDQADDGEVETEPVLDVLSTNPSANNQITTQPLHVGDLRLADLRKLMQASGHAAEFRGEGTLLVDGTVVVRKTANGRIEIEGGNYMASAGRRESAFFAVRRKVYEGLAVIAGS